jgi:xylobiose transport system substrate-binding protein
MMVGGQAAFELMGSWDYSTVQAQSASFASSGFGYAGFPSIPGGKGNLNDLAGNTENYYSVLAKTRYPQAVAAFLKVMYSPTFVKKELALGNLTTTTSTPNLITGTTAPYLKFQYNLIKKAPAFQLSWDQAWPQTDSNSIHTAVADYFDNLDAGAFESSMAGLTPAG